MLSWHLVFLAIKLRDRYARRLAPVTSRQPSLVLRPSGDAELERRLSRIEEHVGIGGDQNDHPLTIEAPSASAYRLSAEIEDRPRGHEARGNL
jgi:hypothetical protein